MPVPTMDYASALEYISATGRFGIKMGLQRTRALLDELGAPDAGMRGALVAGTNGKGSTCALLTSVLVAAGFRTGSMPKPHLHSYTERIRVDGVPIAEAEFAALVSAAQPAVEAIARRMGHPTEFEMLTAAALRHLHDERIELLVCEVGLGGRLDSTNVLDLGVKVITGIDLDHTQYLGPDLASIAGEKAGIIRHGDIVVLGDLADEARTVINATIARVGATTWAMGDQLTYVADDRGWHGSDLEVTTPAGTHSGLHVSLVGRHQAHNAALAVAAADAVAQRHQVGVPQTAIAAGLSNARWPGRLELARVRDTEYAIDGAHNPAAVSRVVEEVSRLDPHRAVRVVFGAMADKDHASMLALLPRQWPAVLTAVDEPRALPAEELLAESRALGRVADEALPNVVSAIARAAALTPPDGLVLVLGSLYLAGAARSVLGLA